MKLQRISKNLAKIYLENSGEKYIKPVVSDKNFGVYHIFNIKTKKHNELKEYLLQNGIKTEIHYPIAPHNQIGHKDILVGKYFISEDIHNTTLSLPISYFHTNEYILKICEIMNGRWND